MPVPAYMTIRQYAVGLVMESPGQEQKILSERELCRTFEVTRPTVRKALKDLIDDGHLVIRPGLGTYTNPRIALNSFASSEALSIGIIVGDGKHVNYGNFFSNIMIGSLKYIASKGDCFRIVNIMNKGVKAVKNISLLNVNGIIWVNPPENMLDIINGLEQCGISVVVVNRFPQCDSIAYVGIDYVYEGYIVAKQFIDKKHKNILLVIDADLKSDVERLRGFKKAFHEKGLIYNEDYLLETDKDIDLKLQKIIDSNFSDITGIYALKYETLKALEAFRALKIKSNEEHMIIALEYIMRLKPEIECYKAMEPLEEVGFLAAEKLSEKIKGTLLEKIEIKLKPKILQYIK
jgi:DNA-binding LacI/PurR family transcriptional regulator